MCNVQMSHVYLFLEGVHDGDMHQVSIFVAFSITAFIMERTSHLPTYINK